jgi:hypothetical protein
MLTGFVLPHIVREKQKRAQTSRPFLTGTTNFIGSFCFSESRVGHPAQRAVFWFLVLARLAEAPPLP